MGKLVKTPLFSYYRLFSSNATLNLVKLKRKFMKLIIILTIITINNTFGQYYASRVNTNNVIKRTMKWEYGNYIFTNTFTFNISDYHYYKSLSKRKKYTEFVREVASRPYLIEMAKVLRKDAEDLGYNKYQLVEYLAAFVQQCIVYTKDPYNFGYDYPKHPIESIVEQKGDCEDSSILLAALISVFNIDCVFIEVPGHVAVGVAINNPNCKYYNYNNKKYGFIETTNKNWKIGDIPDKYKNTSVKIYTIPNVPKYAYNVIKKPKLRTYKPLPKQVTIGNQTYCVKPNETKHITCNGVKITLTY